MFIPGNQVATRNLGLGDFAVVEVVHETALNLMVEFVEFLEK
jgi:hypothetical protein